MKFPQASRISPPLQGEPYSDKDGRSVVGQLPPECGQLKHVGARLKKSAYGLKDAPRRWWNRLDESLKGWGLIPTRADRCAYVAHSGALFNALSKLKNLGVSKVTHAPGANEI